MNAALPSPVDLLLLECTELLDKFLKEHPEVKSESIKRQVSHSGITILVRANIPASDGSPGLFDYLETPSYQPRGRVEEGILVVLREAKERLVGKQIMLELKHRGMFFSLSRIRVCLANLVSKQLITNMKREGYRIA
jgi:hypothetical protein